MTVSNQSPLNANQQAVLALWQQVNASLSAYQSLLQVFGDAATAWRATADDWQSCGVHHTHIQRHQQPEVTEQLLEQVHTDLLKQCYRLIFQGEPDYPRQLLHLYDPPPLLFVMGEVQRLHDAQIAIVGSRKPTPHAQKLSFDMAQYLAASGYVITSGLARGVDRQAHLGALAQTDTDKQGLTVGVMGTGIDVCYPRQNQALYEQIMAAGGCLITELLPATPASPYGFPRRNRLVAGLSLGTVVTEAALKSGSLITARLTAEQGKQVFAVPSHVDNHNAEGCHHLIREGATLIYHPDQVLDDLSSQQQLPASISSQPHPMPTSVDGNSPQPSLIKNSSPIKNLSRTRQITQQRPTAADTPCIPDHLQTLYNAIDWSGQDVDSLVQTMELPAAQLLGQLMELELLGVIMQQGGRYLRI